MRYLLTSAIFSLSVILTSATQASQCKTDNGTTCSITCSTGSESLACARDTCSGSCSDSSGNMEIFAKNIAQDVYIAGKGLISLSDIKYHLQRADFRNGSIQLSGSFGSSVKLYIRPDQNTKEALFYGGWGSAVDRGIDKIDKYKLDEILRNYR